MQPAAWQSNRSPQGFITRFNLNPNPNRNRNLRGRPINNLLNIDSREKRVLKVAVYWNNGIME
jgi:hypothetical protein